MIVRAYDKDNNGYRLYSLSKIDGQITWRFLCFYMGNLPEGYIHVPGIFNRRCVFCDAYNCHREFFINDLKWKS